MPFFKNTIGIYSLKEMKLMGKIHTWKNVLFAPLLRFLTARGISANGVSFFSGIIAALALAFSLIFQNPYIFVAGIWLHMLVDGIDGSLARFQKKSTPYGAFVDMVNDHIGILGSGIFLIFFGLAWPEFVLINMVLYTLINTESFILGYWNIPYSYVLRPRLIIYAALTIHIFWPTSWMLTVVLFILCFPLVFSTVEGLVKIGKILHHASTDNSP